MLDMNDTTKTLGDFLPKIKQELEDMFNSIYDLRIEAFEKQNPEEPLNIVVSFLVRVDKPNDVLPQSLLIRELNGKYERIYKRINVDRSTGEVISMDPYNK